MKRYLLLVFVAMMAMCIATTATADTVIPYASAYFANTSVALSNVGMASFSVTMIDTASSIRVLSCSLQEKNGSSWTSVSSSKPTAIAYNTCAYAVEKSYRSLCTPGKTYRITATFEADGHTSTCTSPERTF